MKTIKYRQYFKGEFYFWGYIDGHFQTPLSNADACNLESQQFTGLTDKNNKEIYEGDILKSEYNGEHSVIFRDGTFCIKHVNEADGSRGCCKPWRGGNLSEQCNSEEVIGNIYETPELLN